VGPKKEEETGHIPGPGQDQPTTIPILKKKGAHSYVVGGGLGWGGGWGDNFSCLAGKT